MSPRGFGNFDISAKVKKNEETVRIRPPGPFFLKNLLQMYIRTYKIDISCKDDSPLMHRMRIIYLLSMGNREWDINLDHPFRKHYQYSALCHNQFPHPR